MKKICIAIALGLTLNLQASNKVGTIPTDEGMFPFVISFTGEKGATDFSHLLDAPAGKDGFVRVEGQHFVTDKGRIRFNATNLTGEANFPSHEQAERLAARMARFGINCVRLHFMDCDYGNEGWGLPEEKSIFLRDGKDKELDPERIDRLDYLLNQFKQRGIYVDVNLYVARGHYNRKGRNAVEPALQQEEKDYAKTLLTHVNPYTGLTLATDPMVAMIELNNEDALFFFYLLRGCKYKDEWPSTDELLQKTPEEKIAFMHELEELERNHWTNMRTYLREELGVRVPITSTQLDFSIPWAFSDMDYYDMHAYWLHPNVSKDWYFDNRPMVNETDGYTLWGLSTRRPVDRPYTISEYNHPYPNFYGAEGQPMLHAYGAFQGWDGVFAYSWHNRVDEELDNQAYFFSFATRTDCLAHFQACAAMYLRGDVAESPNSVTTALIREQFDEAFCNDLSTDVISASVRNSGGNFTPAHRLVHRTAIDYNATKPIPYPEEPLGDTKISDTKELEWNNDDPDNGMFIVRSKNTKVFSGFPAGRTIDWGDGISLEVGETKLGWTTMSMTSKKGNGFTGKSTALLVATGYTHNTGAKFVLKDPNSSKPIVTCAPGDWGEGPVITEGIPATVTLATKARRTRCWALDEHGQRYKKVPVKKSSDKKAVIEIGPEYKTVWYEIETRKGWLF